MANPSPLREAVSPAHAAGIVFLAALAAILSALGFEHLGGYAPCPLCLQERWAYYAAIPAGAAALALMRRGRPDVARGFLVVCALAFAANAAVGVYHSGVEWHWWPGPASCSGGTIATDVGDLIDTVGGEKVVRCDEAPWRLFGLSFAGYSALISAALALVAGWGAARARS